jgi:hypothetical protein
MIISISDALRTLIAFATCFVPPTSGLEMPSCREKKYEKFVEQKRRSPAARPISNGEMIAQFKEAKTKKSVSYIRYLNRFRKRKLRRSDNGTLLSLSYPASHHQFAPSC